MSTYVEVAFYVLLFRLAAVTEEKEDLEKLHDLNEELQENAREVGTPHWHALETTSQKNYTN